MSDLRSDFPEDGSGQIPDDSLSSRSGDQSDPLSELEAALGRVISDYGIGFDNQSNEKPAPRHYDNWHLSDTSTMQGPNAIATVAALRSRFRAFKPQNLHVRFIRE
ncbi:hypothetical protein EBR96_03370 [bacterium]|nr:hypothetical protein [bacterium]